MTKPTVHMLHGFVGVGKSTFARKLEAENKNIIRFTIDEWMIALFGKNPPKDAFKTYEGKIKNLIWDIAVKNLNLGNDVILDFGFWKRVERDDYKSRATDLGFNVKLYNITCADDILTARVLKRTAALEDGAYVIDQNAINEFRNYFEPVTDDEGAVLIDTN